MKYLVVKGFQWRDCTVYGREGQTVDAADLKTGDGAPLPPEVVARLVSAGCLQPVGGKG